MDKKRIHIIRGGQLQKRYMIHTMRWERQWHIYPVKASLSKRKRPNLRDLLFSKDNRPLPQLRRCQLRHTIDQDQLRPICQIKKSSRYEPIISS